MIHFGKLLLATALFAGGASHAQEIPMNAGDGMGDHIASQVVNMNGFNITNLSDPFFEGDAVTLRYFNEHAQWSHEATQDINLNGFAISGVSDIFLGEGTLHGGVLAAPVIAGPQITGGTISAATIKSPTISVPEVTGGTFESAILSSPVIDNATLIGGEISDTELRDNRIVGATFSGDMIFTTKIDLQGNHLKDARIENGSAVSDIEMSGNLITGLGDAAGDTDAMSQQATRVMIKTFIAEFREEMASDQGAEAPDKADASITEDAPEDDVVVLAPEALSVDEALVVMASVFRDAPGKSQILGNLSGSDSLSALNGIDAVIYRGDGDVILAGIDPESIPDELAFMVSGDADKSIDYVQMIGPMLSVIQHLDRRIRVLEGR